MTTLPVIPTPLPELPAVPLDLFTQIYTHASVASSGNSIPYDRLACLGDACLTSAITNILYRNPAMFDSGEITEIRKTYVSNPTIATWARVYQFDTKVNYALHMRPLAPDALDRMAGAAFQAYLGAVVLSSSQERLTEFISELVAPSLDEVRKHARVPESTANSHALQELHERLNRLGIPLPDYPVEDRGKNGQHEFFVKCIIRGHIVGAGAGLNKMEAKRRAAQQTLSKTDKQLTNLRERREA
jgi:dsRNA-specific ribonuclease